MSEYGDSSAGRVYERLEKVFEGGIIRIEKRLDEQGRVLGELRERVTRLEERGKGLDATRNDMRALHDRVDDLEKAKATERGIAIGAGAAGGGILGWVLQLFTGGTH